METNLVRLQVDDLASDGTAVAHRDGKVVFLDAGLPGETVLAEITRARPNYDRARVTKILNRSPARTEAACRHFGTCGGCCWQDLDYAEQLRYKKQQVVECLARVGRFESAEVADVLAAENAYRYRNKMEFSFHAVGEGEFRLGLHRRGRFDDVFDLDECHLQSETLNGLVDLIRRFIRERNIPVYDVRNHTGYMRFLVLRQARFTDQTMVNLVTNLGGFPDVDKLVAVLTEQSPEITTITHGQNGRKSNVAVADVETVLYGPGFIEERILDHRFRIRANSFFQTNSAQAERLYQVGFDLLRPERADRLLDLYCGAGTIGLLLARRVRDVTGVELVPDAVELARQNAGLNGIRNVSFFQGPVRELLKNWPAERKGFQAVILDPPRAGLHPKALRRVIDLAAPKLLYISCNPATFARDARSLCDSGYAMSPVQPVDMFPHTRHVETATVFRR